MRGTQVAHEDAARGAVITQTQVLVPALSRQCSGQAMVEQVLVVKCADLARAGEREREREREMRSEAETTNKERAYLDHCSERRSPTWRESGQDSMT